MSDLRAALRAEVMPRTLRVCYDSSLRKAAPQTKTTGPACFDF